MSNNPFIPYAYFPTVAPSAPPPVKIISNFCELLGVEFDAERAKTDWCSCGNCPSDLTVKETACCNDVKQSTSIWARNWQKFVSNYQKCYSTHQRITDIVKNINELDNFIVIDQVRLKEKAHYKKEIYIDEYVYAEENDKYRFACYRKLTFLVHEKSTFGKRIQLPACVVAFIRQTYPSPTNEYKGYDDYSEEED